ncbi:prepilin-type N-terminal cleavage/methylation domain-containing protein [Methylocapsa polymorpha]|uniref:Prepilin-type N-terminal cleavage/methylation domain-containing protein n=1 Tax=Methylocapsa polymorpha TaxID=3080828 RepID=A0ABZ0HUY6_9HYPH|nr:prepilin-type N-terminal cleavage/methylation domain-containing protein [Methylocapsa sp. RX1]
MRRARTLVQLLASDARGFTLFEALVAVALMGLILTILGTVTAQWLPSWKAGFGRVQRTELLGLGLDRIVADLAAAEFISPSGKGKRPLFDGSPSSAIFVRSAIGPNKSGGLEIVRLADSADDHGLVRARAPFTLIADGAAGAGEFEFSDAITLMRDPFRVSFAFAGRDRAWRDTWSNALQLPDAVRVTVRDGATDQILAVSTAALLHVNAPAECASVNSAAGCIQTLERPEDPGRP